MNNQFLAKNSLLKRKKRASFDLLISFKVLHVLILLYLWLQYVHDMKIRLTSGIQIQL